MAEYVTKEQVKEEIISWARCINNPERLVTEDALYVIDALPPADVVPWYFLERYADWFCALVQYPEFIREAKRFYMDSIGAMEGGEIDD